MRKIDHLIAKGKRFLYASLLLRFKLTDKLSFEDYPHPIHLRRNSSDIPTFHKIFTFHDYAINLKFEPQYIIDAGANIGLAAVFFAKKYPNAKIICIEPEKSNFEMLQKNIQGYKNITAIRKALSNTPDLYLNVIDNGGGNWAFATSSAATSETKNIIDSVPSVTIDAIMSEFNFPHLDLLKIDIEGAEKELFESDYEKWLPKIKCLMIELHDGFKQGCSKNFFRAISNYDFRYSQKGENLIFYNINKI